MKQFNVIIAIALMGLSQMALASVKVTVNGMVCSFCAQGIEKSISKMDEENDEADQNEELEEAPF